MKTTLPNVLGIPIRFDPYETNTAMAHGPWWNRYITVSPKWLELDQRTQYAIVLHEAKHCRSWHKEQRALGFLILCLPLLLMPWRVSVGIALSFILFSVIEEWFARQELDADQFAAEQGYGLELLRWVKKHPYNAPFYPSFDKRCKSLEMAAKGERRIPMFGFVKRWLSIGITANQAVITGYRQPTGYQQISAATLASATKLTIPTRTANLSTGVGGSTETVNWAVGYAVIQNSGTGPVRWRDDGTAPTASTGMQIQPGGELDYAGDLNNIQFILASGAPILDVSVYL